MWAPALPDLNPMDFSVWSMLKANVSCGSGPSVDASKISLLREWAKIHHETLRTLECHFIQRIKVLIGKKRYIT